MKTEKITEKTAISILNSARPRKGSYYRLSKAFDMAIKALEKQIPKKPVFKESTDKHEDGCWTCPVCGGTIGVYDLRDNWCSDCGIKIDWSE